MVPTPLLPLSYIIAWPIIVAENNVTRDVTVLKMGYQLVGPGLLFVVCIHLLTGFRFNYLFYGLPLPLAASNYRN